MRLLRSALVLLTMLTISVVATPPRAEAVPLIGTTANAAAQVSISLPDLFGLDLDDLLKTGGIVWVVEEYGPEINDAINTLLDNNDAKTNASTKVVLILSPDGGYLGAAQVTGPRTAVEKVRGVAQLEKEFKGIVRLKVLIPVSAQDLSSIRRVQGVAVSAVIDMKI